MPKIDAPKAALVYLVSVMKKGEINTEALRVFNNYEDALDYGIEMLKYFYNQHFFCYKMSSGNPVNHQKFFYDTCSRKRDKDETKAKELEALKLKKKKG
jgi:hypothetical protein